MSIERTWVHLTTEVPENGVDVHRVASADECRELASELDVPGVACLEADYRIRPARGGVFKLTGEFQARIVQACVVTLEPITSDIRETLGVEFRPADAMPEPERGEQEALALEEIEPITHHQIRVGRVIAEALAAAIDPYPRTPGAVFEIEGQQPEEPEKQGPFAALARLKPKAD
ncbi:MAG: DUF177 domain-containing protein [Hyphomicrobiaceae bacterium]